MNLEDLRDDGDLKPDALPAVYASSMDAEVARTVAQVQGGMVIAKKFPRDEKRATTKLLERCRSINFAQQAKYAFKRGNTLVTGPSIRLLESAASLWGNIDYSVEEVLRDEERKQSIAMCYAVDLESNTWVRRKFIVPHRRDKSDGATELKNDRDVYEMVANMGARRVRACLEGTIPGDVIDAAFAECEKTVKQHDDAEPLATRVEKLIGAFERNYKVTPGQIAKWLKRPVKEMLENEFQQLRSIYFGIQSNVTRIDEHFEPASVSDTIANKRGAGAAGGAGSAGSADAPNPGPTGTAAAGGNAAAPARGAESAKKPGGVAGVGQPSAAAAQQPAGQPGQDAPPAGGGVAAREHAVASDGGAASTDSSDRFDDDWSLEKAAREGAEEGAANAGPPTKESILKAIAATKTVDEVNALGPQYKALPEAEKRECSKAAFARVKAIAAEHARGGAQS